MDYKYYSQQSVTSTSNDYTSYFDGLPSDIRQLCEILQNVMLHYFDAEQMGYVIPAERLTELELRYAHKMMERIIQLDDSPLDQPRKIDKKLIGCCRDFSLLLCSILRHKNIPARLRFGFSTFQIPGFHHDQVLLEYWDDNKQIWVLVDARINSLFIKKYNVAYKSHEVSKNAFFTAAEAWQYCRSGSKSAEQFGSGNKHKITGWWYIRNKLIQDFAALNKMEMLLWDCWGMMLNNQSNNFLFDQRRINLLDSVASLLSRSSMDIDTINRIYLTEEDLHVAKQIYCDSHVNGGKIVEL